MSLPQTPFDMSDHLARTSSGKPHNACDECRARKLKCSGEATGCSRCIADGVTCRYSPRKQMGRPRKKRREDENQASPTEQWGIGNGATNLGSPNAQADSRNIAAYPELLAPQLAPNGFAGLDDIDEAASSSLNFGYNNMGMNYMSSPHSNPMPYDMPPTTSGLDYSQDFTTNLFSTPPPWTSSPELSFSPPAQHQAFSPIHPQTPAPNQLPTPPSMNYDMTSPIAPVSCSCLPTLYKTLSVFPATVASPTFPQSISPLKQAIRVAQHLLSCNFCGQSYNNALQNSMGLVTLLHLIITTYAKLLQSIERQAQDVGDDKMTFRMGELKHLSAAPDMHTGTNDCPMGISVDLSGGEWRTLARKSVKREIWGATPEQGGTVVGVLEGMAARQQGWHGSFANELPQHPHHHQQFMEGSSQDPAGQQSENCICVQTLQIGNLRRMVDGLGLRGNE